MKPSRQHDNHDSLAMLPWYPRDWRASTARAVMSALARGIYRELLDAAWLDGGSLPAEERTLIALAGCTVHEWRKAGPEVLPRFDLGQDGRLRQGRLSWQHERAAELREKQRKAALTATEARQRKIDAAHGDRDGDRGAQRDGDRNGDRTPPTPTPTPSPTPTPTPVVERTPPNPPGGEAAEPPVVAPTNGNGHGTLPKPKGLGAATERELERLLSDERVATLVDTWAKDRGRTNREIGVARAAMAALAGGYQPDQLALVSRLVALAGRQPERFPDRGSIRWAAQTKPGASYVWRSDALDKLIPECEAWERS